MSKEDSMSSEKPGLDLETVLEEVGEMGPFQWRVLALAVLVAIANGCSNAEFVFTTARINTRCLIPECEVADSAVFSPPWLAEAVPPAGDALDMCQRYGPRNVTTNATDSCPASLFDTSVTVACEQYVYEEKHTVVYDLELACDEWRRSFIGSMRNAGMLVTMPLTGLASDRWGRRVVLVVTSVNTALIGSARYWANTYGGYVAAHFIEAVLGGGSYTCSYILLLELSGSKYRVCNATVLTCSAAVGRLLTSLLAWLVPYWRPLTLIIYSPQVLFIFYLWIAPESIRWYQSKGKFDKAEETIKKVAKVNGRCISESTLKALKRNSEAQKNKSKDKKEDEPWLIVQVFQNKPILIRCLASPVWWITSIFIYYGLSYNAVNMVGGVYLNYFLVSLMEIPGGLIALLLGNRVGRRPVMLGSFWLCALCQVGFIFISNDMVVVSLIVYLIGKISITVVITTMYFYTTELFPTKYRHSLFAFSSMMGRIGTILAPLTPALGLAVGERVPFVMFGGMAVVAGLLVLLTPETRGKLLPDTMEQAAHLSTRPDNK